MNFLSKTSTANPNRRFLIASLGSFGAISPLFGYSRAHAAGIDPHSVSEGFLYSTARITGIMDQGSKSGTGFFYSVPQKKGEVIFLITNNHVVRGTKNTSFLLHTKSSNSSIPDGHLRFSGSGDLVNAWISHPDPSVDLCALPIGPLLNNVQPTPFLRALTANIIPSSEQLLALDAIEDVTMVGYPIGLSDEVNDYPIFRKGITASDPAVDFNGKSEIVVDMAFFPGSSGSPVFIRNTSDYATKDGTIVIGNRLLFLGVLYGGPTMAVDGKIVTKDIPTSLQPSAEINIMINLGYIIKSSRV